MSFTGYLSGMRKLLTGQPKFYIGRFRLISRSGYISDLIKFVTITRQSKQNKKSKRGSENDIKSYCASSICLSLIYWEIVRIFGTYMTFLTQKLWEVKDRWRTSSVDITLDNAYSFFAVVVAYPRFPKRGTSTPGELSLRQLLGLNYWSEKLSKCRTFTCLDHCHLHLL